MELFFLCTILMAGVSFLSTAMSQPPVNLNLALNTPLTTSLNNQLNKQSTEQENNSSESKVFVEFALA